jgi:hypothetical protein
MDFLCDWLIHIGTLNSEYPDMASRTKLAGAVLKRERTKQIKDLLSM